MGIPLDGIGHLGSGRPALIDMVYVGYEDVKIVVPEAQNLYKRCSYYIYYDHIIRYK